MEEISPYNLDNLEVIPKKYRCFTFVAYDDSDTYDFTNVLANLKTYKNWAYIKHFPEENEKKCHYHFIIKLDNATTCEAVSKKIGIPVNYIQYVRNERAMCRYLIHFDDPEKIPYTFSDLKISKLWSRKFKKHFEDLQSEEEIMESIYTWIDTTHFNDYYEKLKNLLIYINLNSYDSVYKRFRYEFLEYLKVKL